jgi:hypothetical protein
MLPSWKCRLFSSFLVDRSLLAISRPSLILPLQELLPDDVPISKFRFFPSCFFLMNLRCCWFVSCALCSLVLSFPFAVCAIELWPCLLCLEGRHTRVYSLDSPFFLVMSFFLLIYEIFAAFWSQLSNSQNPATSQLHKPLCALCLFPFWLFGLLMALYWLYHLVHRSNQCLCPRSKFSIRFYTRSAMHLF